MDRYTVVFTTDRRQESLGELFSGEKYRGTWKEYEKFKEEQEAKEVQIDYIFPTPVSKLEQKQEIVEKLKEELTREENVRVYGGAFPVHWMTFFEENQIPYLDFMKQKSVVEGNAMITAEATIAEILKYSSYSISGQKILVMGFGVCGKAIGEKLKSLGAKITIVARSKKARNAARERGYEAVDFNECLDLAKESLCVVNTVPALVVTKELISNLPKDSLIVDIASKPGGTNFEAAKEYGIHSVHALGLPGKYTTKSSALLLKTAINENAGPKENRRGEKEWIFQIII